MSTSAWKWGHFIAEDCVSFVDTVEVIETNEFAKKNHGFTYKLDFIGEHGDPG